ncbi:MAG: RHS repeat-associated core domain-containing protein, partial [Chloroflexota bacterium]
YLPTWNGHGDLLALWQVQADGTLTLAASVTYDTWGKPNVTTANGIPDLGWSRLYVGRSDVWWDNAFGAGLLYMHARTYSPTLGRFLQPDPIAAEGNLYAYAGNSPVTKADPSGLKPSGGHIQHRIKVVPRGYEAANGAAATAIGIGLGFIASAAAVRFGIPVPPWLRATGSLAGGAVTPYWGPDIKDGDVFVTDVYEYRWGWVSIIHQYRKGYLIGVTRSGVRRSTCAELASVQRSIVLGWSSPTTSYFRPRC